MYEKSRWGVCTMCGESAIVAMHHFFSQTKINRKLYGNLIDDDVNLSNMVCHACHSELRHIDELEFCERLGIKPRSKTAKLIYERNQNWEAITELMNISRT